jgi:hypothetical protein
MRTLALAIGTVAALSLTACGTAATSANAPSGTSSTHAMMVHETGTFMGLNGKQVSGTVTVTDNQVTLSGFSSDQGPDLHIYLAKGTDETTVTQGSELAPVSYSSASQTFNLNGVNPSGYTYVVIHCDKAKAVFGAAPLS